MTKTLIIGGSRFLGPELIRLLMDKGHEITLFNRGNDYGQNLPSQVRVIVGDRRQPHNLRALGEEQYDYVYDMCCYNSIDAENVLTHIKPPKQLVLLSTTAVYAKPRVFPLREDSALGEWDSFGDYGTNKVLAENMFVDYARQHQSKITILRPVYLLGNNNYFDRENYYFSRIAKGLPILMPGKGDALIQFAFLKETAEAFASVPESQAQQVEILNIAGNEYITLRSFVNLCAEISGKAAVITEIDAARFGLDEEHFYDDLYPFPNLHFIASNRLATERYGMRFQDLEAGLKEIYANWESTWDGSVKLYPQEEALLKKLR